VTTPVKEQYQNLLPPSDLARDIEKLREDLGNERDRSLRTLADFNNYRRRVEHEGQRIPQDSIRANLLPLLDIIDDIGKRSSGQATTRIPSSEACESSMESF
jgi:molecular chaperone GrpE